MGSRTNYRVQIKSNHSFWFIENFSSSFFYYWQEKLMSKIKSNHFWFFESFFLFYNWFQFWQLCKLHYCADTSLRLSKFGFRLIWNQEKQCPRSNATIFDFLRVVSYSTIGKLHSFADNSSQFRHLVNTEWLRKPVSKFKSNYFWFLESSFLILLLANYTLLLITVCN